MGRKLQKNRTKKNLINSMNKIDTMNKAQTDMAKSYANSSTEILVFVNQTHYGQ